MKMEIVGIDVYMKKEIEKGVLDDLVYVAMHRIRKLSCGLSIKVKEISVYINGDINDICIEGSFFISQNGFRKDLKLIREKREEIFDEIVLIILREGLKNTKFERDDAKEELDTQNKMLDKLEKLKRYFEKKDDEK